MPVKRKPKSSSTISTDECQEAVKFLLAKPDSEPFRQPVDWEYFGLTDYPEVIKTPMDLGTVEENLTKGKFSTTEEFISDVNLIWANAMKYNQNDSDIFRAAEKLKKVFDKRAQKLSKESQNKKSAKKKGDKEVTKGDRIKFSQLVNQLSPEELEQLVEKIQEDCPQALTEEEDDELEISINNIDPTTLLALNAFCQKCINSKQGKRT